MSSRSPDTAAVLYIRQSVTRRRKTADGDYTAELLPETAVVRRWGGRTVVVPYHRGHSTTEILSRRA